MQTSPTFLTPTAGPRQTEKRARNTRGDPAKRKDFPMQILFRFLSCLFFPPFSRKPLSFPLLPDSSEQSAFSLRRLACVLSVGLLFDHLARSLRVVDQPDDSFFAVVAGSPTYRATNTRFPVAREKHDTGQAS